MPFLIPLIPLIATGIAGASAGVGAYEQNKQSNLQQKGLSEQEQIANQEMADKQQIFKQLVPFFTQYLGGGSPYLAQTQRASAEQTAQGANNATGQLRNTEQASGMGYGPSGSTAEGVAQIGAAAGQNQSQNYLQNLLNNEQLKFQAATGLQQTGSMAGSSQNQPNVSANLPQASLGGSAGSLGQILQGLLKGSGTPASTNVGNLPQSPNVPNLPGVFGAPTVGGTDYYGNAS